MQITALPIEIGRQSAAVRFFEGAIAPLVVDGEGELLGYFVTEPSENMFPSLPIREGDNVLSLGRRSP